VRWNRDRAEAEGFVLIPQRWETDTVPLITGTDGQSVINSQIIDSADILISVFHSRLGMPTGRAPSGTAEEIERAVQAGRPVHVYFSNEAHPPGVDLAQLSNLRDFRSELQSRGLTGSFDSMEELRRMVHSAIDLDVQGLRRSEPLSSAPGAKLRAEYVDSGRPGEERLVIRNAGHGLARAVEVTLQSRGTGEAPNLWNEDARPNIQGGTIFTFPVVTHAGTSQAWDAIISWEDESGMRQTIDQTLTHLT
jgi:hypothetical protein